MSGRGGSGGGGKGNNGVSAIPAASRKMVQSLKEIVNCPENEIYAMLKECNMDPNDAVNRLLAQDPFHEVKSKREKKKENKDTSDPRSRGASNTLNRGSRGGSDRHVGRGGSTHFSSTESGSLHGKPAYKKENGTYGYTGSASPASGMAVHNTNRQPPSHSENRGTSDGFSLSSQPSPGFQSAWVGVPGQVSMADIVKMGRPQSKANPTQHNINQRHGLAPSTAPHHDLDSTDQDSKVVEIKSDYGVPTSQHIPPKEEWPRVEKPQTAGVSSISEAPADTEPYADSSNLPLDRTDQHVTPELDEDQESDNEDEAAETLSTNNAGPAAISSRNIQEDNYKDQSLFDNDSYVNVNAYQPHRNAYEHNEVQDNISSLAADMGQLNLQNDDQTTVPEEKPSVVIPNHLQVYTRECSQLSFGSFGSFASGPQKSNLEETSTVADAPSVGHSENISSDYYGEEHLRPSSDGSLLHTMGASAGSYEHPSTSESEVLKQDIPDATQGNQYAFPTSSPDYAFENAQQLNVAFSHSQASSQMQNLAPFSDVMAYPNSLPSALLASTVQSSRDSDVPYSPFPESMATKYSNVTSSIAMPESLRAGSISTQQLPPQALSGAGVATGPALPRHLAMHPYSQPNLPLAHYANMLGYPFLPQSYAYMPSAFQQAFAGNSTYNQSLALAAMLPQYKSASVSSLPQSASGYGLGTSTSVPGNFPLNQPAAPTGTAMNYDDVISAQYKDANHLISLQQQNDNSGAWVHGPGSRTMPTVPASTYYGFQGQNQQPSGYRQAQQPSQQYGGPGFPNFYHSQTGMSLEQHQQQNPRDGSLGGSQGQQSKQSQQLWQNSY